MTNDLYKYLKEYFNDLIYSGYHSQQVIYKLLILDYIENLTDHSDFQLYVSDEEILSIEFLLNYINTNDIIL